MAEKLNPEAAMDMTIAEIAKRMEWTTAKGERFLRHWYCYENEKMPTIQDLTLRAFLANVETHGGKDGFRSYRRRGYRKQTLVLLLKQIGITRLQTHLMPRTTVAFEMLAALPREQLLKRDAGVLGTLSDMALDHLCEQKDSKTFSVADLLAENRDNLSSRSWRKFSTASTFALLNKLGFGPEDGLFMAMDPRELLAIDLAVNDGLTADEAKKFADIAARRNWI